ncbi:hypothetical protein K0M31_019774 [Melipona bicolor]|uniref:Uncharacterized protein n=1 Tax=Melipona bicolor TaxID=60889 RepID=A0AA40G325_9HYME|nr:hypothetical protein K0M31_019774 [Melipona bicolor]
MECEGFTIYHLSSSPPHLVTLDHFSAPNKENAPPSSSKWSSKWGLSDNKTTIIRLAIKPIRIFQFLVVLLIFVLVIYTTNLPDYTLPSVMCILLMTICGVYVLVLSIDLITQFIGGGLNMMPMFLFSLLGVIFFAIVAFYLLLVNRPLMCHLITMGSLSIIALILFIVDVSLIHVFRKRTCDLCQPCGCPRPAEVLFQKKFFEPLHTETVKHDLTTSVSCVKIPTDEEDAVPDHSMRKVSVGRRRQYVDCPISAQRLCDVNVADVQTDHKRTLSKKCQTRLEVKEVPAQTVSRCELCKRTIELSASPSVQPTTQQQPCVSYPAFMQLLRGSTTCCPGCRCVTSIIKMSQQQQTQRLEQLKQDGETAKEQQVAKISCDSLTKGTKHEAQDPKLTAVSGRITKLTLASYCVTPKKTDTCSQTPSKPKKDESEQTRRTRLNAVRLETKKTKKTGTASSDARRTKSKSPVRIVEPLPDKAKKSSKGENSDTERSTLFESSKCPLYKSSDSVDSVSKCPLLKSSKSVEELTAEKKSVYLGELKATKSVSRSDSSISGGSRKTAGKDKQQKTDAIAGKESDRVAADLISKTSATTLGGSCEMKSKENAEDSEVFDDESEKCGKSTAEHSFSEIGAGTICQMETQTNSAEISFPANRVKRTYGFRRNKVEPTGLSYTDADIQTPDHSEGSMICSKEVIVADESSLEANRVCAVCKRIQVPASSSLDQYYAVHRDKKGRFYCEYCATPSLTAKVLYKNDQKRLKCARCGSYIRAKNIQSTRNKSESCPHCGQALTPAQPT